MNTIHPWQWLLVTVAGSINREQQDVIDYLVEETRVLERKSLRWTDAERRRLAVKDKILGRRLLEEFGTIVTPDTILAWCWRLVARKWNCATRWKPGRPRTKEGLSDPSARSRKLPYDELSAAERST